MPKAVRFDNYGGVDVLNVVDVPRPVPGPGQVLVQVKAAGINPGEAKIRDGLMAERFPATFPSGQGSDLAGIVAETGPGVTGCRRGRRGHRLHRQPGQPGGIRRGGGGQPDRQAGRGAVAGGRGAVRRRGHRPTRRSGRWPWPRATCWPCPARRGGVGSIAVQLARRAGATVVGLASPVHHEWLAAHGVIPVSYGEGVADRIRQAAGRVDAFIDTVGGGYVRAGPGPGRGAGAHRHHRRLRGHRASTASRARATPPGPAPPCWPSWPR